MKIGVCGDVGRAILAKEMGYDYIEENLSRIGQMTDSEFDSTVKGYEKADMPVYSFNGYIPRHIAIYEKSAIEEIRKFSLVAIERASILGGKVCVLGSGAQRRIPEGMDRTLAEERFLDVVHVCGEIADKKGIKIAIEPLSKNETNFINFVEEGADIARKSGLKNVGTLVDFFHFFMNNDTKESLLSSKDMLFHTHIARPNPDRLMPIEEDLPILKKWADMLKEMNYKGTISVEAIFMDKFESMVKERTKYLQVFRNV